MKKKIVKEFPDYVIDERGGLWSKKTKRYLKTVKIVYETASLCKNGKSYTRTIHRLMAEAFIPNPENKPQVNHKDANKINNVLSNLEWVTHSENMQHAMKLGLVNFVRGKDHPNWGKPSINKGKFYDKNPRAIKVSQYNLKGKLIKIYKTIREAGEKTNTNRGHISSVCQGKRKTAGGFKWEYAV